MQTVLRHKMSMAKPVILRWPNGEEIGQKLDSLLVDKKSEKLRAMLLMIN
jgi:thymidylate kinase